MRRPLAFFCALIVVLIFLLVSFGVLPLRKNPVLPEDGEYAQIVGRAEKTVGKYILVEGRISVPDDLFGEGYVHSIGRVRLLVSFSDEDAYVNLGESVVLSGKVRLFSHAMNPGEFDGFDYYTAKGGDVFLRDAVIVERDGGAFPVREGLRRLRAALEARLYSVCPEKEASILCDLLLGDKEGIDEDIEELYQNNGIAHILSISGLHISILGMGLYRILRKIGCKNIPAAMVSAVVLLLYGIMTGMSVSATRAIGMFMIRMFSYPAKRTADSITSLMFMAAITALWNPAVACQAGFLLSYGAALSIIIFLPSFEAMAEGRYTWLNPFPRGRVVKGKNSLKGFALQIRSAFIKVIGISVKSLRASFAITLFTLPVQLYFFYRVSVYSVFLNILILPCMSVLVLCAMVSLIPGLGIFASISVFLLESFEHLCRIADRLPFHTYNPGRPGNLWIILYYSIILLITVFGYLICEVRKNRLTEWGIYLDRAGRKRLKWLDGFIRSADEISVWRPVGLSKRFKDRSNITVRVRAAAVFLLLASVSLLIITAFPLPAKNTMTQLYIGQGNCNVTVTDAGEVYMFDGGSTSKSQVGKYTILPFLRYSGLSRLDAVFISHSDADHINGVMELIENADNWGIKIGGVYVTMQLLKENSANSMGLISACSDKGIPLKTVSAGDEWYSGGTYFICLHPDEGYEPEDPNSGSMCILAEFMGRRRVLIPGDVQGSGEEALTDAIRSYFSEQSYVGNADESFGYGDSGIEGHSSEYSGSRRLDVYITAHHGSSGTTTDEFLDAARPILAINSAGENNRYHHPHTETLQRLTAHGCTYLTTYETGAITLTFSGNDIKIKPFNSS